MARDAVLLEVYRVTPRPKVRGPVTAWAGPSGSARRAVAVATEVLALPPRMRVTVDQEDSRGRWRPYGQMTVGGAEA